MENENKKITVITDRPLRWNKTMYDVITLLDMTNDFDNRGDIDNAKLVEEEKIIEQEDNALKIKEKEENRKKNETLLKPLKLELNKLNKERITLIKEKKNTVKIDKQIKDNKEKIKTFEDEIKKINNDINEIRKNKSEIEKKIADLEKELESIKNPKVYTKQKEEIAVLQEIKKKEDERKKKKEEEEDLKKYKSVRKNQVNNIVIIDESITNTDIEMFTKVSNIDFFNEIRDNYINKDAYSILVKPINIYLDKPDWFKKGVFRFTKKTVYDIYSNKEDFELNVFFKTNKNITEFRRQVNNILPGDNFEQKYQLYKEKMINDANQKDVENIKEYIYTVKDYETFITNRNKFATFLASNINNTNLNTKIQEASNHIYTKELLEEFKKKYDYKDSNRSSFPYTKENQLNVFYIIELDNKLTNDPAFENRKQEIANNIGIFANYMKGAIIQSVSFLKIPNYDAVDVFKVDGEIYYKWLKKEPTDSEIAKKFIGKPVYENHMKTMRNIMNNLKVKKNIGIPKKGGSKTRRNRNVYLNKTRYKKI